MKHPGNAEAIGLPGIFRTPTTDQTLNPKPIQETLNPTRGGGQQVLSVRQGDEPHKDETPSARYAQVWEEKIPRDSKQSASFECTDHNFGLGRLFSGC